MENKMPVKVEDGSTTPESYKKIKCSVCGVKWYVPEDTAPEDDAAFVCPLCSKAQIDSVSDSKAAAEQALKG